MADPIAANFTGDLAFFTHGNSVEVHLDLSLLSFQGIDPDNLSPNDDDAANKGTTLCKRDPAKKGSKGDPITKWKTVKHGGKSVFDVITVAGKGPVMRILYTGNNGKGLLSHPGEGNDTLVGTGVLVVTLDDRTTGAPPLSNDPGLFSDLLPPPPPILVLEKTHL